MSNPTQPEAFADAEDDKDLSEAMAELRKVINPFTPGHEAYSHDSERKTFNPDWMKHLPGSVKLTQLSLAGTHDSMALHGTTEHAVCQRMTLQTQLESGIRALDIRCKLKDGDFKIYHGSHYQQCNFGDVLTTLAQFLKAHPSETVVMRMRDEDDRDKRNPGFEQFFVDHYWNQSYPFLKNATGGNTLAEDDLVMSRMAGHIVMLDNFSLQRTTYGTRYLDFDIQDHWEMGVITHLYNKWERVAAQLLAANHKGEGKIVNFLSASPSLSFPYFVASGKSDPRTGAPRLATGRTTPIWKNSWLDFPRLACIGPVCSICYEGTNVLTAQRTGDGAGIHQFVGIVYADFPGPALIDRIIGLNDRLMRTTLPGLAALVRRLASIKPEKENKDEWQAIRKSLEACQSQNELDQFKALLSILGKTEPRKANREEWRTIRSACADILKSLTPQNQREQFKRLVQTLGKIEPKVDNRDEWRAIRFTCGSVLLS